MQENVRAVLAQQTPVSFLQPQGLDVMSSLVRATYLCGARPGQHSEQRLDGGRPLEVQRVGW
jgi:hypothetical protein